MVFTKKVIQMYNTMLVECTFGTSEDNASKKSTGLTFEM